VAKSQAGFVKSSESGQILAFFAVAVPVVLLPIAAYAVDATMVAGREAALQAATAQAAETAAQQINVGALRSSGALSLDAAAARLVLEQTLVEEEPGTIIDSYTVTNAEVSVATSEPVTLPFSLFTDTVVLHAHATARLVAGYETPA
jgi:hypothetical protein